jgi:ABC-type branched-subunit amino acid transport system ATPase component
VSVLDTAGARADYGVVGRAEYGRLRDALRISNLRWRPLVSLALLGAVGALPLVLFTFFNAEVARVLATQSTFALLLAQWGGVAACGIGIVALVERGWSRGVLALAGGVVGAVSLAVTAFSSGIWQLAGGAILAGASGGAVAALHLPILVDHYRPEVRMRAFCIYAGAVVIGMGAAAAAVALGEQVLGLTWRGVDLALAGLALLAVGAAAPLPDRPVGQWDARRVMRRVQRAGGGRGGHTGALADDDVPVRTLEKFRQVLALRTAPALLSAAALWGVVSGADRPFLLLFWEDRWSAGVPMQASLYGLVCVGGVVGLGLAARRGEVAWRLDPGRLLRLASAAAVLGAICLAAAVPTTGLYAATALAAAAFGSFAVLAPVAGLGLLSVVLPRWRAHAALLLGVVTFGGTVLGQQLLGSVGDRFGARWALVVTALVGAGLAARLRTAAGTLTEDLDATIARVGDDEALRVAASQGQHLPLLGCRQLDFAYGPLQVLFDVDFSIDDGEMVALLGTNGAGKSTLLRVISGLEFPQRGSVQYRGTDITFVDPSRRVALGIAQVPGGRAVFGPMSVLDNLRVFGFSHGHNQRAVEQGVEAVFAAFPALGQRRHQHAATLSGGEQQMLALGKSFILSPRLLLIDELSLGLAPIVVAELLEMVRQINSAGTAVVLVEQSVTVALSLVEHAYFMEKGAIRFDGPAAQLVERPDLLRSVFLEGAAGRPA